MQPSHDISSLAAAPLPPISTATNTINTPVTSIPIATRTSSSSVATTRTGRRVRSESDRKKHAGWRRCPRCGRNVSTNGRNFYHHMHKCDRVFFAQLLAQVDYTRSSRPKSQQKKQQQRTQQPHHHHQQHHQASSSSSQFPYSHYPAFHQFQHQNQQSQSPESYQYRHQQQHPYGSLSNNHEYNILQQQQQQQQPLMSHSSVLSSQLPSSSNTDRPYPLPPPLPSLTNPLSSSNTVNTTQSPPVQLAPLAQPTSPPSTTHQHVLTSTSDYENTKSMFNSRSQSQSQSQSQLPPLQPLSHPSSRSASNSAGGSAGAVVSNSNSHSNNTNANTNSQSSPKTSQPEQEKHVLDAESLTAAAVTAAAAAVKVKLSEMQRVVFLQQLCFLRVYNRTFDAACSRVEEGGGPMNLFNQSLVDIFSQSDKKSQVEKPYQQHKLKENLSPTTPVHPRKRVYEYGNESNAESFKMSHRPLSLSALPDVIKPASAMAISSVINN